MSECASCRASGRRAAPQPARGGSPCLPAAIAECFAGLSAESNTEPYRSSHDPWTFTGDTPAIDDRIREALAAFEPRPEGFAGQFSRYHQALQSGAELPVTRADARAALELITAVYHSARTRAPVQLPLDVGHPLCGGWQLPGRS